MSNSSDSSSLNSIKSDLIIMQQQLQKCSTVYNTYVTAIPNHFQSRFSDLLRSMQKANQFIDPKRVPRIQKEILEMQDTLKTNQSQFQKFSQNEKKRINDHSFDDCFKEIERESTSKIQEILNLLEANVQIHLDNPPSPSDDEEKKSSFSIKSGFTSSVSENSTQNNNSYDDTSISPEKQAYNILNQQKDRLNQLESNVSLIEIREKALLRPDTSRDFIQSVHENHKTLGEIQDEFDAYLKMFNSPLKSITNHPKVPFPKDIPQQKDETFNSNIDILSENFLKMSAQIEGIKSTTDQKLDSIEKKMDNLESRINKFSNSIQQLNDKLIKMDENIEETFDKQIEKYNQETKVFANSDFIPLIREFQNEVLKSKKAFQEEVEQLQNALDVIDKSFK